MWRQNLNDLVSLFDQLTLFKLPWNWEAFGNNNFTIVLPSLKGIEKPLLFNIHRSVKTY